MFTVTVRDHTMVAHSFRGEAFGPAQRLHGATFVVDVSFCGRTLDDDGVLLDIGAAAAAVRSVLSELDYRNLDDDESFAGTNTTVEVVAQAVANRLAARIAAGDVGENARSLESLVVTLHESHIAWASYERAL